MKENQLARKIRLIRLLQSGSPATADRLAQDLEISKRTVFRDLRALEHAGVDVRYDKPRQGYLIGPPFYLRTAALNVQEVAILIAAAYLSPLYTNKHYWGKIQSASGTLLEKLDPADRDDVLRLTDALNIERGQGQQRTSSDHVLHTLIEATWRKRPVRVKYCERDSKSSLQTLVTPKRLIFSPAGWRFKGRSSWHCATYQFDVNCILEAHLVGSPADRPEEHLPQPAADRNSTRAGAPASHRPTHRRAAP